MNYLSVHGSGPYFNQVCLFFPAIHQKLEADGTEKVEGSMTQRLENVLNSKFAPLPKTSSGLCNKLRGSQGHVPSCALASLLNKDVRSLEGCGKSEPACILPYSLGTVICCPGTDRHRDSSQGFRRVDT